MNQQPPNERIPGNPARGMPWKWRLLFLLLFFGPAAYASTQGDLVLGGVLAMTGISAFAGFRLGATSIVTSVIALAAAYRFAPLLGYEYEWRFTLWLGTTGLLNRLISIGTIAIAISLVSTTAIMLMTGWLTRKRPGLDRVNRWMGFWIGGVEGLVATVLLLGGVLVLEPIEQQRRQPPSGHAVAGHPLSNWVLTTADHTRRSNIGPWIEQYNPFVQFPELNKIEAVQKSVNVLSDPQRIERLLHHPEIRQLQQSPEVQTAFRKVTEDPEIRSALHSSRKMTRDTAMILLSHPAVLELIDQPGFIESATKAIRGTTMFAAP